MKSFGSTNAQMDTLRVRLQGDVFIAKTRATTGVAFPGQTMYG